MKRLALILLLVCLGVGLAGCAGSRGKGSPTTSASAKTTGSHPRPSTVSPLVVAEGRKAVSGINIFKGARILSPTRLAVVTWGSSGCAATPKSLVVQSPNTIRINLSIVKPPPATVCPADYGPTPFVVSINPKQINVHKRLTIRFYYPRAKKPFVRTAPPL